MSTYDAYNLSLRDSTEFTVPTGGSGEDSNYELVDVTFVNNSSYAIAFSCTDFINDSQYESLTGFSKNIGTKNVIVAEQSIAMSMLIPMGGATFCTFEIVGDAHIPTANVTGDIRTIDNQNIIIVYGSGTVTFSDGSGDDGNPK